MEEGSNEHRRRIFLSSNRPSVVTAVSPDVYRRRTILSVVSLAVIIETSSRRTRATSPASTRLSNRRVRDMSFADQTRINEAALESIRKSTPSRRIEHIRTSAARETIHLYVPLSLISTWTSSHSLTHTHTHTHTHTFVLSLSHVSTHSPHARAQSLSLSLFLSLFFFTFFPSFSFFLFFSFFFFFFCFLTITRKGERENFLQNRRRGRTGRMRAGCSSSRSARVPFASGHEARRRGFGREAPIVTNCSPETREISFSGISNAILLG